MHYGRRLPLRGLLLMSEAHVAVVGAVGKAQGPRRADRGEVGEPAVPVGHHARDVALLPAPGDPLEDLDLRGNPPPLRIDQPVELRVSPRSACRSTAHACATARP